jgi:hypothetical protein
MLKDLLLNEMIKNQRDNVPEEYKLYWKDMKRVLKHIDLSIFDKNCCCWKGYITYNKNYYVNFYLHGKKLCLHRILYINYVDNLHKNEYLTFDCDSIGCLSLKCMFKKNKKYCDKIVTPKKYNKKCNKKKSISVVFF